MIYWEKVYEIPEAGRTAKGKAIVNISPGAKIYAGENWDSSYRSPLTEPGVDVHEGEFLLAIDGIDLPTLQARNS